MANEIEMDNNLILNQQDKNQLRQTINNLGGYFTKNVGQIANKSVKYYIPGGGVWFLSDGVVFDIKEEIDVMGSGSRNHGEGVLWNSLAKWEPPKPKQYKSVVIKQEFMGAEMNKSVGKGKLSWNSNFFYGNDSAKWYTNVPNYKEIVYENIYENIDLKYYIHSKGLKYDFIVHPGGNPNDIKLYYNNIINITIDNSNNLIINTQVHKLIDSNLYIYQKQDGYCKGMDGRFKILNVNSYGFEITGNYNKEQDLIIDPIIYSTFIGGSRGEYCRDLTVDKYGNVYATGHTTSSDFPNTTGVKKNLNYDNSDLVILKLNSNGTSLLYSTYIGGAGHDGGGDILIDPYLNVYVTGGTNSSDFPNTTNAYDPTLNGDHDIFLLKLNTSGSSLIYSTFIGGQNYEDSRDMEFDSNFNILLTGRTESHDFPTTAGAFDRTYNGGYDGYVLKMNLSNSSILSSTFFGGTKNDTGHGMEIDPQGNIYLTGDTDSNDFPSTPGAYNTIYNGGPLDVFVVKFNNNCSNLIYSTFIGGRYGENGMDIAIDSCTNVYVCGETGSPDFPNTTGVYNSTHGVEAYLFKLNPSGSNLIFSTFIGGTQLDCFDSLELDPGENIYLTGVTGSDDFPTTGDAIDNSFDGGTYDAIFVLMSPNGKTIIHSTYLGGNKLDEGIGIALDSSNNIYLTGLTYSPNFPNSTFAYDRTHNSDCDCFIMKLKSISVINNTKPSVIDLKVSPISISINKPVHIFSNASDAEDLENELTPNFEYRDPNDGFWNNSNLSIPIYNNSRWEVKFDPPKNTLLGAYDFRVRYRDTNNAYSCWFYWYDALTIVKKEEIPISMEQIKPNITLHLQLDKYNFYTNENITGNIKIINNNSFNIYTVFPSSYGENITIEPNILFEANESTIGTKYFSWDVQILKINAKSNLSYNFSLEGFNHTKKWTFYKFKLPIGNYSINSSFIIYAQPNINLNLSTNTKHFNVIKSPTGVENISIILTLTKHEFYISESINGNIIIYNNNSYKISLNNQLFQMLTGCNFNVFSIDKNKEYGAVYNYLQSIEVEAKGSLIIYFEFDRFIIFPLETKQINYTNMNVGNYSMYSYFYYGDSFDFEEITSNTVDFQIIADRLPGIENISIILELTKTEYMISESINGTITISNENLFDVLLENNILSQRSAGEHLEIYSIDTYNEFGALIKNITYPIKIKAKNSITIYFSIKNCYEKPLESKELTYIQLATGNYSIFAFFYYDNLTDSALLISNSVFFRIIDNNTGSGGKPTPPTQPEKTRQGTSTAGLIIYTSVGLIIVILIITTTFITSTEIGKYGFVGWFIIPLYTKSRRKKLDKNYGYKKGLILGYILGNPGENYNSIKKVLNMNNGALTYYLRVLEREGTIKSERDGMYKRFYPTRGDITKDVLELSDVQKSIYQTIKEHMGISQKEISNSLGVAQSTVNYHVLLMANARLIRMEREGKVTKCFVLDENLH